MFFVISLAALIILLRETIIPGDVLCEYVRKKKTSNFITLHTGVDVHLLWELSVLVLVLILRSVSLSLLKMSTSWN